MLFRSKLAVQVQQEQVTEVTLYDTVAALTSDETFLREELQNEPVRVKVIRGPWSKGVQICSPGGVQIRSPRAEADHWVFKSAVVSQGNLGIDVAGQVGTAAPVFDSASGVPVSDSARPVTLSCNTWCTRWSRVRMRSLCRFSMHSSSSPAAAVPVLHRHKGQRQWQRRWCDRGQL